MKQGLSELLTCFKNRDIDSLASWRKEYGFYSKPANIADEP